MVTKVVEKQTDTEKTFHAAKESAESLKQQYAENVQKQQHIQNELANIQFARQQRAHRLSEAHTTVASYDNAHSKAVIEAKLAQGTAKEHVTVKAVADILKDLNAAKKTLVQAEQECAEREHAASVREQELIALLTQLQADQGRLQGEERHTLDIARVAHDEAGRERYAAILAALPRITSEEDEIRSQLLAKQVEKHDFFVQSIQSLSNWPELQRELSVRVPKDDSVSVLALAALFYLEAVIKEAPGLKKQAGRVKVPITAGTLENLFSAPQNEIAQAANGQPQALQVRIGHLQQVLSQ